jgi:hypothetical protein
MPARLDLTTYRGDTLAAKFRMRSNGKPVDVREWEFRAYIRESVSGPKIAEFTIYTAYPYGDAQNGMIRMLLPPSGSQELPDASVWDLQAVEKRYGVAVRQMTLLRGFVYASADVTYEGNFGVPAP